MIAGLIGILTASVALAMGFSSGEDEHDKDGNETLSEQDDELNTKIDKQTDIVDFIPNTPDVVDEQSHPSDDQKSSWQDGEIITGTPEADTLLGSPQNDQIGGKDGTDLIQGQAGDDQLFGMGGEDTLQGGDGYDTLHGQSGNDVLSGQAGDDVMFGHEGKDTLDGGTGDDRLQGGGGQDLMKGGSGDDALHGYLGNDTLVGHAGQDSLFGGHGDDVVDGRDENNFDPNKTEDDNVDPTGDYLNGGKGNDIIFADANDTITGGDGADSLILSDWIKQNHQTVIFDFDPDEDRLMVLYDAEETPTPELTIEQDGDDETQQQVYLEGEYVATVFAKTALTQHNITLVPMVN
ncbi:calcium-binding protein [Roseovarius sp. EL26]|uniref:calcium-binding protein n=1 Tax=Roseovarius sp. EL26 TaxID=2126672 RepID=UPI000EA2C815|nr:calcium-binding protein [Roseovarius sp. EL26]